MCIFTQTLEPYQIKLNLANLIKIKNAKLVTVNNKQKWTLKEPVCARGFHLAFPFLKVFYTNCLRNTFLIITAPRARNYDRTTKWVVICFACHYKQQYCIEYNYLQFFFVCMLK